MVLILCDFLQLKEVLKTALTNGNVLKDGLMVLLPSAALTYGNAIIISIFLRLGMMPSLSVRHRRVISFT